MIILIAVVLLILILKNKENYWGQLATGADQLATIVNPGLDIDLNNWTSSTAALGATTGLGSATTDAQLAPADHFRLQLQDLNRICWSDTTGKCAGFRKELKVGGGGQVWYLYISPSGSFPSAVSGQAQIYSTTIIQTLNKFSIPQFVIASKSVKSPNNGYCTWLKTTRTCLTTPAGQCGVTGIWQDTYNVTNYTAGQCFGSEGQALTWGNGLSTIAGAPCTAPACASTYDDGIPGTATAPTTPPSGFALTATSLQSCQDACIATPNCKIIEYKPGTPVSCKGYEVIAGITPSLTSYIYKHP